jgi:hypothetical protein
VELFIHSRKCVTDSQERGIGRRRWRSQGWVRRCVVKESVGSLQHVPNEQKSSVLLVTEPIHLPCSRCPRLYPQNHVTGHTPRLIQATSLRLPECHHGPLQTLRTRPTRFHYRSLPDLTQSYFTQRSRSLRMSCTITDRPISLSG